jgi:hypothetical protein
MRPKEGLNLEGASADDDVRLTAILEAWTINDGNYPEMSVGMFVNLAFEMSLFRLEREFFGETWTTLGDARYRFSGTVIQRYEEPEPLVILRASTLAFFSEGEAISDLSVGNTVSGEGVLIVDYYAWTEDLKEREAPADIFYDLVIERIRRLERTMHFRHFDQATLISPLGTDERRLLETIDLTTTTAASEPTAIYLVDFRAINQPVRSTFVT